MPIALFHGGPEYLLFLMIVAIVFVLTLVLIFVLLVRGAESKMRRREESEKFFRETGETK
jgi:hypothetical protein